MKRIVILFLIIFTFMAFMGCHQSARTEQNSVATQEADNQNTQDSGDLCEICHNKKGSFNVDNQWICDNCFRKKCVDSGMTPVDPNGNELDRDKVLAGEYDQ